MSTIHLSFSRQDKPTADRLRRFLESLGHEVPNPDDVTFDGYSIEQRSRALIATADATIVIWTDHSAESEWVRREATLAAQIGKLFAVHDPQFINFDRLPHPLPNLHSTRVDDLAVPQGVV